MTTSRNGVVGKGISDEKFLIKGNVLYSTALNEADSYGDCYDLF